MDPQGSSVWKKGTTSPLTLVLAPRRACSALHTPLQPFVYCGLCLEGTPLPPLFLDSSLSMVRPPALSTNASTLAFAAAFSVFSWTLSAPRLLFSRATLELHRLSHCQALYYLIFMTTLGGRHYYHVLFHRKATGPERLRNMPKVTVRK